jgi:hypothetical protein
MFPQPLTPLISHGAISRVVYLLTQGDNKQKLQPFMNAEYVRLRLFYITPPSYSGPK